MFSRFFISKLIAFSCLTYFRVAWQFSSVKSGTLCRSPLPTKTTSRRRIRGRMARHSWFKDCWVLRKTEPPRFVDSVIVWPGYEVGFKMATSIAKFKIGAFKKQFSGPSLWNLKTHWKVSFYIFFFDDRVEKRNCEIFFRTKFSFAFKSVNNIFEKKGNRFIRLWTIPGLFYSAQLVKHFSFFFITDKDYGYLLSWGLGFILWCSSFSEWVFP